MSKFNQELVNSLRDGFDRYQVIAQALAQGGNKEAFIYYHLDFLQKFIPAFAPIETTPGFRSMDKLEMEQRRDELVSKAVYVIEAYFNLLHNQTDITEKELVIRIGEVCGKDRQFMIDLVTKKK